MNGYQMDCWYQKEFIAIIKCWHFLPKTLSLMSICDTCDTKLCPFIKPSKMKSISPGDVTLALTFSSNFSKFSKGQFPMFHAEIDVFQLQNLAIYSLGIVRGFFFQIPLVLTMPICNNFQLNGASGETSKLHCM